MAQTHEAKTSFKGASKDESKDNGCDTECPFCGISGISSAELLIHVNQDHLDFMTPENELMSYIDDQTPRFETKTLSHFILCLMKLLISVWTMIQMKWQMGSH